MKGEQRGGLWEGRRKHIENHLPPVFGNTGKCIACGKTKHVNTCGFCQKCWVTFSHLRRKI